MKNKIKFFALSLALLFTSHAAMANKIIYDGPCKPTEGYWIMHTSDNQVITQCVSLKVNFPRHITLNEKDGPAIYDRSDELLGYYNPNIN